LLPGFNGTVKPGSDLVRVSLMKRLQGRFLTMGNRQNERKFAMVLFLLGLVVGVLAGLAVGVIVGTALAKNIWICG